MGEVDLHILDKGRNMLFTWHLFVFPLILFFCCRDYLYMGRAYEIFRKPNLATFYVLEFCLRCAVASYIFIPSWSILRQAHVTTLHLGQRVSMPIKFFISHLLLIFCS